MSKHQSPSSEEESDDFITTLNPNDVLCGRGSGPNDHTGNVRFRSLVTSRKEEYLSTNNRQAKARIARDIIDGVYNATPPGRFLRKADVAVVRDRGHMEGDAWAIVDEATALEKAKQALRQNPKCTGRDKASVGGSLASRGSTSSEAGSVGTVRSSVASSDVTIPTKNRLSATAGSATSSGRVGSSGLTPQIGSVSFVHQEMSPMDIGANGSPDGMASLSVKYESSASQGPGGIDEAPFYPGQHPLSQEQQGHPYSVGSKSLPQQPYGQQAKAQAGGQCRRSLMSRTPAAKNLPEEAAEAAAHDDKRVVSCPRVENLSEDFDRLHADERKLPLEPVISSPRGHGYDQRQGPQNPQSQPHFGPPQVHGYGQMLHHEPSIYEASPLPHDGSLRTMEPVPYNSHRRESGSSFANNSNFSMASMNSSTFSFSRGMGFRDSLTSGGSDISSLGSVGMLYSGRSLGNRQDSIRAGSGNNEEGGGGSTGRLDQFLSKSGGHGYRQDSERFRQDSERFRHDLERYRQDSARYGLPQQDSSHYGVPRQDSDRSYLLSQLMTGQSTRKSQRMDVSEQSMSLSEIIKEKDTGRRESRRAVMTKLARSITEGTECSGDEDELAECGTSNGRVNLSVSPHHRALVEDPRPIHLIEDDPDSLSFLGHSSMSIVKTLGDSSGSSMSGIKTMCDSERSKCSSTMS